MYYLTNIRNMYWKTIIVTRHMNFETDEKDPLSEVKVSKIKDIYNVGVLVNP